MAFDWTCLEEADALSVLRLFFAALEVTLGLCELLRRRCFYGLRGLLCRRFR